jgi:energy-coupling factor transport system ATP-binding protein
MNSLTRPQLILDQVQYQTAGCLVFGSGHYEVGLHLVTGPIGSGKSTVAGLMAGVLVPDSGVVSRKNITRSLLSVQFPEYYITSVTIAREIESWGLTPAEILHSLSLEDRADDPVMSLSRGELKRLHLACVCAQNCELMIFDEPFASLDENGQRWLRDVLLDAANSRIVVISTHYGVSTISSDLIASRSEMSNGSLCQLDTW